MLRAICATESGTGDKAMAPIHLPTGAGEAEISHQRVAGN